MKRKLIMIMAISMIFLILAGCKTANALDTIDIVLKEGKNETITTGGNYSISGSLSNGQIIVDTTEEVVLELAGVSITNSNGSALQVENAKSFTLSLKEGTSNTLIDGGTGDYNAALFSNDTITIQGEGKLTVTGNQAHGIESDDDVIINGGEITITAVKDGMHANDNITINEGTIHIERSVEGIESKGDIVVNGGNITVASSDDGINAASDITINGGNINVKTTVGDAIDSNGTIHMNGGNVVAIGGNQPEGGIDCDKNNLSITGGTLIATGGSNSTPTQDSSTQYCVMLAGTAANTAFRIQADSGEILNFTSETDNQSMLFSSPLLEKEKTYTIYTNDVAGESFTISSMVTMQGGTAGMGGGGPGMGGKDGSGKMPLENGERPTRPERQTTQTMQTPKVTQ